MNRLVQSKKIIVVFDNSESCQRILKVLSPIYDCSEIADGEGTLSSVTEKKPDLVLLNYEKPGCLNFSLCRCLRENKITAKIPIVFISGTATIAEKISAFEQGASDFIFQPFHQEEFLQRVKARFSRKQNRSAARLTAGNLQMDCLARKAFIDEAEVALTKKQFDLLMLFVAHKNKTITRKKCLDEVWPGMNMAVRNVDTQVNYLKNKLKDKFNGRIVSIRSHGYSLKTGDALS